MTREVVHKYYNMNEINVRKLAHIYGEVSLSENSEAGHLGSSPSSAIIQISYELDGRKSASLSLFFLTGKMGIKTSSLCITW